MKDDDGFTVEVGDVITFNYGIPPVKVLADLVDLDDELTLVCRGNHTPKECPLRLLRSYVGNWYKAGDTA